MCGSGSEFNVFFIEFQRINSSIWIRIIARKWLTSIRKIFLYTAFTANRRGNLNYLSWIHAAALDSIVKRKTISIISLLAFNPYVYAICLADTLIFFKFPILFRSIYYPFDNHLNQVALIRHRNRIIRCSYSHGPAATIIMWMKRLNRCTSRYTNSCATRNTIPPRHGQTMTTKRMNLFSFKIRHRCGEGQKKSFFFPCCWDTACHWRREKQWVWASYTVVVEN